MKKVKENKFSCLLDDGVFKNIQESNGESYVLSNYNFLYNYNEYSIHYNALKNTILALTETENLLLKDVITDLHKFKNLYPELFMKFIEWGFIINHDFSELNFIKFMNKKSIYQTRNYRLTINPTLDCNMNCWYCTVDAAGAKKTKTRMDDATIERIKKHGKLMVKKEMIDGIFLDWFGGEPLLYFDEVIYPIAVHFKRLSIENKIPFTHFITTNGYLINENIINKLNKISLNSFQITLDGNEERHNKIRNHNGEPTFNKIIENIILICKYVKNSHVTLRINYDRKTLADIIELIPRFPKNIRKQITITFQKVFQIETLMEENQLLKSVTEKFANAGYILSYWAFRPNSFFTCYSDKLLHAVVNFDGNVYKCTARDYGEKIRAGYLENDGQIKWNNTLLSNMFANATFENDHCLSCKYLALCMGPCIQKCYETKNMNVPFTCLLEDAELKLETVVISEAKRRQLI